MPAPHSAPLTAATQAEGPLLSMRSLAVEFPVPGGRLRAVDDLSFDVFMIISQWVQFARLVRGLALSVREREDVQAARAFGVRGLAMVRHHILPSVIGPVILLVTLNVANNILLESSLTVLGLGQNLPGDWLRDRIDPTGKL